MKIVPIEEIPKAQLVPSDADSMLINKLWAITEEMCQFCIQDDGIGLHAVQVGIIWDLFIVNLKAMIPSTKEDKFYRYFNCSYRPDFNGIDKEGIDLSMPVKSIEGCLSLNIPERKRYFEVPRYRRVIVEGKILRKNLNNKIVADDIAFDLEGLGAIVYQHEIDHGKSILVSDIGTEIQVY